MTTAPVSPPPRPPRDGNIPMGFDDWHDDPKPGAMFSRYWRMLLKFVVLGLLALALGQLGFILFQIVRLQFFS